MNDADLLNLRARLRHYGFQVKPYRNALAIRNDGTGEWLGVSLVAAKGLLRQLEDHEQWTLDTSGGEPDELEYDDIFGTWIESTSYTALPDVSEELLNKRT